MKKNEQHNSEESLIDQRESKKKPYDHPGKLTNQIILGVKVSLRSKKENIKRNCSFISKLIKFEYDPENFPYFFYSLPKGKPDEKWKKIKFTVSYLSSVIENHFILSSSAINFAFEIKKKIEKKNNFSHFKEHLYSQATFKKLQKKKYLFFKGKTNNDEKILGLIKSELFFQIFIHTLDMAEFILKNEIDVWEEVNYFVNKIDLFLVENSEYNTSDNTHYISFCEEKRDLIRKKILNNSENKLSFVNLFIIFFKLGKY